jgi:hypothetical protein
MSSGPCAGGWTECGALLVREQHLLTEVLDKLKAAMPFSLAGIDTDNDSVFINETLKAYCEANRIEFTRSRPYRKNDQAYVEQKNGAVVAAAGWLSSTCWTGGSTGAGTALCVSAAVCEFLSALVDDAIIREMIAAANGSAAITFRKTDSAEVTFSIRSIKGIDKAIAAVR